MEVRQRQVSLHSIATGFLSNLIHDVRTYRATVFTQIRDLVPLWNIHFIVAIYLIRRNK